LETIILHIFPLQMVAFPGERVALHIFEPRYRRMIAHCEGTQDSFGVIPILDRKVAGYGTTMLLIDIKKKYPDGRMDIISIGDQPFQVDRIEVDPTEENAHRASVRLIHQGYEYDPDLRKEVTKLYYQSQQLLNVGQPRDIDAATGLSFQIAHFSGLSLAQKIELLMLGEEQDRLAFLGQHFEQLIPTLLSIEETKKKISQNGHFRIIPGAEYQI
jgi:Lon protease-like protein